MSENLWTLLIVASAVIVGAGAFTAAYLAARNSSSAPLVIIVQFPNPLTVKLVK